jgi:hypothetical protein
MWRVRTAKAPHRLALVALLASLLGAAVARADDGDHPRIQGATNPLFEINSLQLQPAYTNMHHNGNAAELLLRLALTYDALFIPGLAVDDFYTVYRLEMYAASLNRTGKSNVSGLRDWNALVLSIKPFTWGQVGFGAYAVLPTATSAALGSQELQLGPAFGVVIAAVPHLVVGALVELYVSVFGPVPSLASVQLQPIVAYHFSDELFVKSDGIIGFDITHAPAATVPVNLHVGYAITPGFVISLIAEWVAAGRGLGNVTGKLNLNYFDW